MRIDKVKLTKWELTMCMGIDQMGINCYRFTVGNWQQSTQDLIWLHEQSALTER